jgi:hypothetical protein
MNKPLIVVALLVGLLVLAVAGWTVQGARWLLTGKRHAGSRVAWA